MNLYQSSSKSIFFGLRERIGNFENTVASSADNLGPRSLTVLAGLFQGLN